MPWPKTVAESDKDIAEPSLFGRVNLVILKNHGLMVKFIPCMNNNVNVIGDNGNCV